MTTAVIYSTADDWDVRSSDAVYATARAGASLTQDAQFAGAYLAGQNTGGPGYQIWQMFVSFDTSAVGSTDVITSATLSLAPVTIPSTVTDTLQARLHDWGAPPVTTADWVAGASMGAKPLVAHYPYASLPSSGTRFDLIDDGLASRIVRGGTTRLVLTTADFVAGNAPLAASNAASFSSGNNTTAIAPRLTITYGPSTALFMGSD